MPPPRKPRSESRGGLGSVWQPGGGAFGSLVGIPPPCLSVVFVVAGAAGIFIMFGDTTGVFNPRGPQSSSEAGSSSSSAVPRPRPLAVQHEHQGRGGATDAPWKIPLERVGASIVSKFVGSFLALTRPNLGPP